MMMNRRTLMTTAAATLAAPAALSASAAAPRIVPLAGDVPAGQVHVTPSNFALYWTLPNREALRYEVGIAPQDRWRPGTYRIRRKAEWPRWTPTPAMIRRDPEKYGPFADGMDGGGDNPLGARALYLYRGGRDTFLRIHGTPDNSGIGRRVSNGCVRMTNADVEDLYSRVPMDTVVVLHA
ncbi:L,D-transpeptidase [Pseudooctadecabacter jejudonensis]|uniref:Putative L,D-transpeptidase ErfK/SrfK n=1 Tax=Pseudooctadecabacter jejudonensis TaxID=1391910 RepID=A0A1Y5SEL9_9RHOB|nr:L,D-transpeptidase [Pseudooctadecabacter jejudonensis]SLN35927.1 putative L,D-transpeptidase ErfK/SrfK precursor [Pseudooctadecabacter jejudonensis]